MHCSAGIGRTGSVVMLEYVMDQLLAGQIIEDTDKIIQKIREQRNNSVQVKQISCFFGIKHQFSDRSSIPLRPSSYDEFL